MPSERRQVLAPDDTDVTFTVSGEEQFTLSNHAGGIAGATAWITPVLRDSAGRLL